MNQRDFSCVDWKGKLAKIKLERNIFVQAHVRFVCGLHLWLWVVLSPSAWAADDDPQLQNTQYTVECQEINESSGLAISWRHDDILWTHNDSGDSPRLFALNFQGQHRQEVEVADARHEDWEDIASYQIDGKPQLLIGDVGDNARRRKEVVCYRLNEPNLNNKKIKVDQVWRIRYPDGPQDCEAIAVDVQDRMIVMACKVRGIFAEVYGVPLATGKKEAKLIATHLGTVAIPMITGMDIHPVDGRIVFATYADTLLFERKRNVANDFTDWKATFGQTPTLIRTPLRRQGEAICFDRTEDAIWLTSEKRPAPLIKVSLSN